MGSNVDTSSVTRAVRDMFKETSDILPTAEVIIEEVGKFYDIDPNAIRGQGRTKATSWARHPGPFGQQRGRQLRHPGGAGHV